MQPPQDGGVGGKVVSGRVSILLSYCVQTPQDAELGRRVSALLPYCVQTPQDGGLGGKVSAKSHMLHIKGFAFTLTFLIHNLKDLN